MDGFWCGKKGAIASFIIHLPGCVAAGETREQTRQLIRDAITYHIEDMQQNGEFVPEPTSTCEYVDVRSAALQAPSKGIV
jgi:predicted RNase H-like HicB family nuclease